MADIYVPMVHGLCTNFAQPDALKVYTVLMYVSHLLNMLSYTIRVHWEKHFVRFNHNSLLASQGITAPDNCIIVL